MREFQLPDVGEGVAEGEIVRWLVSVGDRVEEDQPIAEVETDKALVELPSPVDGVVRELRAEEGEMVPVGEVIVVFEADGDASDEAEGAPAEAATADETSPAEGGAPSAGRVFAPPRVRRLARELGVDLSGVEGSGPSGRITEADVRAAAGGAAAGETGATEETEEPTGAAGATSPGTTPTGVDTGAGTADRDRTLAAPATRRIARELGVDIDAVPPAEERDGEAFVTEDAVRSFAESGGEAETEAGAESGTTAEATGEAAAGERVPYRGLRRTIGDRMERSASRVPHATHHDTADATALVEAREALKPRAEERGVRLTYLPIVMKAAVAALEEYPYMNASLDEDEEEIVLHGEYHLGFATATDDGLLVPVVEDVAGKDLFEVAAAVNDLAARARDRSIAREEMRGGTFTITNFGVIGGEYATPIVNHPEAAILGLGAIEERPRAVDGEVVARETLPLSLSIDHRVIDGATAAAFTNRLIEYLENPITLFV